MVEKGYNRKKHSSNSIPVRKPCHSFVRRHHCRRDRKLISLEETIKKMTGASATRFRIKDRGFIKKGLAADITVFNPDTTKENQTKKATAIAPSGIHSVLINGKIIKSPEHLNEAAKPGKAVRI